jgi:hypothetical protein
VFSEAKEYEIMVKDNRDGGHPQYEKELKNRMMAVKYTQRECAYDMGFTESTLRNKLNGKTKFTKAERVLLDILLTEREQEMQAAKA